MVILLILRVEGFDKSVNLLFFLLFSYPFVHRSFLLDKPLAALLISFISRVVFAQFLPSTLYVMKTKSNCYSYGYFYKDYSVAS